MADYQIVHYAEVRCYWCGFECGAVSSSSPITQPGVPIEYRPRGSEQHIVRSLGEVRCQRCGGPVFADNPEKRRVYADFVFRQRRPRRPKVA